MKILSCILGIFGALIIRFLFWRQSYVAKIRQKASQMSKKELFIWSDELFEELEDSYSYTKALAYKIVCSYYNMK